MRYIVRYLAMSLIGLCAAVSIADEPKADGPASTAISIEVLMADVTHAEKGSDESDQAIVGRIKELEKQGKLSRVTRLRLTTLSEQSAMAQFGERAPLAVARGSGGGPAGGGRGGGGPPPGFGGATSYTYQNVGTMVEFVPHVSGGKIVIDCKVEQSRLSSGKAANGADPDRAERGFEPDSIENILAKSSVQLKSGETALLASHQFSAGDGTSKTYILVTASVLGDPRK